MGSRRPLNKIPNDWDEGDIHRMSEDEARQHFTKWRYQATGGQPVCAHCGCDAIYAYKSRPIFKCKACLRQFSVTTNTVFADRKMPFRKILLAIGRFIVAAKGINSVDLADAIHVQYKTAFVLAHKLRALIEAEASTVTLDGTVEIDGAEIGGHIRPKNIKKKTTDHRVFPFRHSARKQTVVVMRQRDGRVITMVTKSESEAVLKIRARLIVGSTTIHADSANWWNALEAWFPMKRINHKVCYYTPDASTNNAESFFSLMRRAARGIHHRMAGKYLHLYVALLAWRLSFRDQSKRSRVSGVCGLIGRFQPTLMKGYWQRFKENSKHD